MKLEVYNKEGESLGREVELPNSVFGLELDEKLDHVVYLAVKQYLAAQRQGTHKAKERAEIKGSTKKIKRQKGTGTARAGDIKNPLFRGGGRVFGPRPRNYSFKLNKKVKRLARKAVLSSKAQEGAILVVEDFTFDEPKTTAYLELLNNLKVGDQALVDTKSLLLLDAPKVLREPQKPRPPRKKRRGRKKKAAYIQAMNEYTDALSKYKEDKKAYDASLEEYTNKLSTTFKNIYLSSRNLQNAQVVDAKIANVYDLMNANCLVLSESAVNKLAELLA